MTGTFHYIQMMSESYGTNVMWTSCLFISLPCFSSSIPFIFPAVYLLFLFCTCLYNLYTLASPLFLYLFRSPLIALLSCFNLLSVPLIFSLFISYLSTPFFRFLFSFTPSFFFPQASPMLTLIHWSPFLHSLPSLTTGQRRVDKMERKPVLTSEGISIYNQSLCIPADQQQL